MGNTMGDIVGEFVGDIVSSIVGDTDVDSNSKDDDNNAVGDDNAVGDVGGDNAVGGNNAVGGVGGNNASSLDGWDGKPMTGSQIYKMMGFDEKQSELMAEVDSYMKNSIHGRMIDKNIDYLTLVSEKLSSEVYTNCWMTYMTLHVMGIPYGGPGAHLVFNVIISFYESIVLYF